jgi:hypothetical protein
MTTARPEVAARPLPVAPTSIAGRLRLAFDDVSFEVDAATGGRVTGLYLRGRNLLTGPDVDAGNYGSTFWTSPQSAWGWPPVPEIDHGPYQPTVEAGGFVLRSAVSPTLGVDVEKRFSADAGRGAVMLDVTVRNRSAAPVALAPWQISRVPPGGLSFFPAGDGVFPPSNLAVRAVAGIVWYAYDAAAITDHQKLFADGREGWLAHVDSGGDGDSEALLVKTFAPVPRPRQAPGEAQLEIYANPAHTYVELEVQGAYDTIAPGGALDWRVTWLVRPLPAGVAAAVGNQALVDHVRALVAADRRAAG